MQLWAARRNARSSGEGLYMLFLEDCCFLFHDWPKKATHAFRYDFTIRIEGHPSPTQNQSKYVLPNRTQNSKARTQM